MRYSGRAYTMPGTREQEQVAADEMARLTETWDACGYLFEAAVERAGNVRGPAAFESELLFCLLSGFGIAYEHALSAAEALSVLDPFDRDWREGALLAAILDQLRAPQFAPAKVDGELRTYRFPNRKAELLIQARRWLLATSSPTDAMESIATTEGRRRFLCECPGIGPKTASWMLRNLGWDNDIAILDVHVLRALSSLGLLPASTRMPRDYAAVETVFLRLCDDLAAIPAAFDLFLWCWQRGDLDVQ